MNSYSGLGHIGMKRNTVGVNEKLLRCKSCGSYRHLVAECPYNWIKYGEKYKYNTAY